MDYNVLIDFAGVDGLHVFVSFVYEYKFINILRARKILPAIDERAKEWEEKYTTQSIVPYKHITDVH